MTNNIDFGGFTKKSGTETVTPHRLAVSVLIQEFFKLREETSIVPLSKRHIRDFCLLIHNLIQNHDIPLGDLQTLLSSGKYTIHNQVVSKFNEALDTINTEGTDGLINFVSVLGKLIMRDADIVNQVQIVQIHKNSVVGYYLRRLLISFDKLTFSEVKMVFSAFQVYYNGVKGSTMRDLNVSGISANKQEWPRRQAELFIAHQAALLSNNIEQAATPKDLHQHIKSLLKSNPDLAEAHFLNYLNCLRVKEYCGAINSLHNCFDRSGTTDIKGSMEEKSKSFRFAALNLAVLYCHFGNREESLAALKEAVTLAQEANDNVCLQHALSWLYCLSDTNKDKLLEHSILKSVDLNLSYLVSLGIQSFVQYAGMSGGVPKYIFETITRSDIVNCQHTYRDLSCISYAQKAAMWFFYGKTEMSSLWSQLLLHTNSELSFGNAYFGEALCQSICNIANHLLLQGEYAKAHSVLGLARDRFPSEPICHTWMFCENIFTFVQCLHRQEWAEAEAAAQKVANYDLWEGRLRIAELHLHKRDFAFAHKCITEILDDKNTFNIKLRVDYHMRTVILLGEVQYISSYPNVVPPTSLNMFIAYVNDFHVDYLGALVYLHLANIQLLMGLPAQALRLLDRCFLHILTHGGNYDRARAVLLYVKCKVANSQSCLNDAERKQVILEGAEMLNKASADFTKVEAFWRVKEVLYLQAQLYNEVNLTKERNKCAHEYRLLDEEHTSNNDRILVALL